MTHHLDRSYILGTHHAELERLGLQHVVWRDRMLAAWRRAGFLPGHRVLDVGAGPGYASTDLAELVGPTGAVYAIERSRAFVDRIDAERTRRGLEQLTVVEGDLMSACPVSGFDGAWCRWVASFVPDVDCLVNWIHAGLVPGGRAVFHEYVNYASWRFLPSRPTLERFVGEVMSSWRDSGGEPDIAPALVRSLRQRGFAVREARPLVWAARPRDLVWQWPAAFVEINARRLHDLGRLTADDVEAVLAELADARADVATIMITPTVLEIIAVRA